MPRKPRELVAGGIYHVFARGVRRAPIFVDDTDRQAYLALLGKNVRWFGWRCLMYCLMGNHLHLLIETPEPNLPVGMCLLHSEYARKFNRRHGHSGHLFDRRYGGARAKDDGQLITAAAYIAANPVEAGMCADPADWPWSSHARAMAGDGEPWLDTPRLLEFFGAAGGDPWRRYVSAVRDKCGVAVSRPA